LPIVNLLPAFNRVRLVCESGGIHKVLIVPQAYVGFLGVSVARIVGECPAQAPPKRFIKVCLRSRREVCLRRCLAGSIPVKVRVLLSAIRLMRTSIFSTSIFLSGSTHSSWSIARFAESDLVEVVAVQKDVWVATSSQPGPHYFVDQTAWRLRCRVPSPNRPV